MKKTDMIAIDELVAKDIADNQAGKPLTAETARVHLYKNPERANGFRTHGELTFNVAPGVVPRIASGELVAVCYVIKKSDFDAQKEQI